MSKVIFVIAKFYKFQPTLLSFNRILFDFLKFHFYPKLNPILKYINELK